MATQSPTARKLEVAQRLARSLTPGSTDRPSILDVAVRLQRVLKNRRLSTDQIAKVLAEHPALAAQLIQVSSAADSGRTDGASAPMREAVPVPQRKSA
jgi:HD-like signal output (HDOD) protein